MSFDPDDTQPVYQVGDTQPTRPQKPDPYGPTQVFPAQPAPSKGAAKNKLANQKTRRPAVLLAAILLVMILLSVAAAGGGMAGYTSGMRARQIWSSAQAVQSLQEQYALGLQDFEAGQFDLARQRFEYILNQDPGYPGAAEKLAQAMAILYATSTPTPPPPPTPTITLTPTRDLRPVQQILDNARAALAASDWSAVIDTLNNLRKEDPAFETARVDGMLFISLRNRGLDRILKGGDLQGGSYDLALAERFAPLDAEAERVRNLARLFMYGNAFWEAYPEQAVYYFSQVAAAAPYLTDGSGWTASARYRAALIQYADALARQELWCEAEEQYRLAESYGGDGALQATVQAITDLCSPPTNTPTITPTATITPTLTSTPTLPVWTETLAPTEVVPTTSVPATTEVPTVEPTTPVPPVETAPVEPTTPVPTETLTPTDPVPPTVESPTETVPPATETSTSPLPETMIAPTSGGPADEGALHSVSFLGRLFGK